MPTNQHNSFNSHQFQPKMRPYMAGHAPIAKRTYFQVPKREFASYLALTHMWICSKKIYFPLYLSYLLIYIKYQKNIWIHSNSYNVIVYIYKPKRRRRKKYAERKESCHRLRQQQQQPPQWHACKRVNIHKTYVKHHGKILLIIIMIIQSWRRSIYMSECIASSMWIRLTCLSFHLIPNMYIYTAVTKMAKYKWYSYSFNNIRVAYSCYRNIAHIPQCTQHNGM